MTKNVNLAKILDQDDVFAASITVGNSTVNVLANSTILKLANSTVNTGIVVPTAAQYAGSYYLHANGTWQLVAAGATPGGANTQVQFNDSTALGGTAGFTFDKATNNAVIANTLTIGTATINSTNYSQTANNALNLGGTAAASYQLNSTLAANVATLNANNATWHGTSIFANSLGAYPTSNSVGAVLGNTISRVIITGNSATFSSTLAATDTTITGFVNATISVNSALHTIGSTFIANTLGVYHTGIVNAASHTTTGFLANATHVVPTSNSSGQTFGNTISRWVMTANSLIVSGGASPDSNTLGTAPGTTTQRWILTANSADIGPNFVANSLGAYHTATMNAAVHSTTGVVINATAITATSNTILLGNTIGRFVITANSADIGPNFVANTLGAYHTAVINAASHTTTGVTANVTGVYPTSNSSGQALGLTAQRWVLFANSIDVSTSITANGAQGNSTTFLGANSTGGVNWRVPTASATAGGANTQVQFNDSTAIGGSAGFTFDKSTNNVVIANTLTTANLTITGKITANGGLGTSQVLSSNSTGGVYWATAAGGAPGGANTNVLFNDSSTINGTAGFTFNDTTNNVTVANNINIGANVDLSTTSLAIGNSTVNGTANSIFLGVANSSGSATLDPMGLVVGNSTVNATTIDADTFVAIGATGNVSVTSGLITVANSTGSSIINPSYMYNGNGATSAIQPSGTMFWGGNNTYYVLSGITGASVPYLAVANATGNTVITPTAVTINTVSFTGTTGLVTVAGGGLKTFVGNSTIAPLQFQSGTNLTTAAAGAFEYDGVQTYNTIDTSSGRGAIPVEQYFHLTANGATIGTIANFFGTTSNPTLVASAYYIIDIWCWFLCTTAGTVTWTFTNSASPTMQQVWAELSPIGGVQAFPGGATQRWAQITMSTTTALALADSGTLATGLNHLAHFKIFLDNGTGTSLKIQATKLVGGTITPLRGSYWFCRRISPNNIGTFSA